MAKHRLHKHELRAKGWTEDEIKHAEQALERAEEKKHPGIAVLDQVVYWVLLVLVIVGMSVFSVMIIPLLLFFPPLSLYPILLIIGITLGTLFATTIKDIHWLGGHHHVFAGIILPLAAVTVFVLVVSYFERFAHIVDVNKHNPFIVAVVFAIAIVLPYLYHLLTDHRKRMTS